MESVFNELAESEKDPDYFFEPHYGHRCFESDDSYTSDKSGSFDENLKPLLYTVEEIDHNGIIVENSLETVLGKKRTSNGNGGSSSEVAKLLAKSITPSYCFICQKQGGAHYMASRHYIKVKKWLQNKLENVMTEPNPTLFFCEICNIALSGDDLANNHYKSVGHNINSVNYCLPCLCPIPKENMATHVNSEKHRLDSQNIIKRLLRIKEQIKYSSKMISNITNNGYDLDTLLLKTDTKIEDTEDLTISMKDESGKEYVTLANYIMDALGPSFCYICVRKVTGSHYNLQAHHKALEQWILGYVKMYEINLRHMEDLICFVCHAVFPNIEYAKIHYDSSNHQSKIRQFCNVCLKKLIGKHAKDHYETPDHKIKEELGKQRNHDGLEKNSHISNVLSALKNQHSSNLDIHGMDTKIIKALIEDNLDIKAQSEPLIVSLLELMTPAYCFICNMSAFKNNKGIFKHYLYKSHRTHLKRMFHFKASYLDLQNYESLYCETCNELFLNFKLAEQHYLTSRHKWNYNLYQTHGSNLSLYQNEFKTNKTTLDDILKGYSTLGAENNKIASSEDKEQFDKSEINHRLTWLKQLANPTTLCECNICSVRLETKEVANFHYSSENHESKVRKWISCHEQNDYSYVNEENQQMFSCCFCDNRFISQQLLNNHTSSHFPPLELEGTKSYNSYKTLKTNMSNDKHQKSLLDNTNVGKLVQKETEKNDEDKEYDSWNSVFESKTTSALQDNIYEKQEREQIENQDFVEPKEYLTQNKENFKSFSTQKFDNKPVLTCDENKDQGNKINKCDGNWESDVVSDGNIDQVFKNLSLSDEIRIEMTKLINEVYFLRTVPLEESLRSLKELNQKLRDVRHTYRKAEIQDDGINNPFKSPATKNRKFLNNLNDDYAKFKLSMEVHRLKMVLSNEMKIPSDVALSYIHNLHQTLKALVKNESGIFDVNSIFNSNKTSSLPLAESIDLESELEQLDEILFKAESTNVQVTLNIITQFNVQLETMLEYQKSSPEIEY